MPAPVWTLDQQLQPPHWRPLEPGPGPALAFSTRLGGVSVAPFDTLNLGRSTEDDPAHVSENRRRLLHALDLSPDRLATAGQVHGATVTRADGPGFYPSCDALVTRTPGLALAITTADCVPLFLVAPGGLAAVHSGWRGTEAHVARAALDALAALTGVPPDAIDAHLGPSIRACCYRVGADVARRFPAAAVVDDPEGPRLDLIAALRIELGDAGIRPECIHVIDACTACEPAFYFSHRRDGARTGRHWAVGAIRA